MPSNPDENQAGEDDTHVKRITAAAEVCLTAVLGKLAYKAFVKYMKDRYGKGLDILPYDPATFEEALNSVFRKSAPVIEEVLVKTLKTEFNLEDKAEDLKIIISKISKTQ